MSFFADFVDNIGTVTGGIIPEMGFSEMLNGGNKTVNTSLYNAPIQGMNGSGGTKAWLAAINPKNVNNIPYPARVNGTTSTGNADTSAIDDNGINSGNYYAGSGGSGGAGGGSVASYNPADIAYLDDQRGRLEGQHRSADTALTNGLTQLQDSYSKEVEGANSRRAQALQDLNTKREDTTRAKDSALNRVNENARTLAEGLRRRIGMASGSGSSAFQITAPGAVSRDATEDRTGVLENFGVNFRDLATTEQRQKTQFEELLSDLEAQRKTRESDFRSGILEKKNQIDTSLSEVARQKALALGGGYNQARTAMAPYAGAIDSRQAEIDNLFNKFRTPFAQKTVDTTAPTLRDYMVDRANISSGQPGPQDPTAPYKNPFGIKEDDEQKPVALY